MAKTFNGILGNNESQFYLKSVISFGANTDIASGKASSYYAYVDSLDDQIIIDSATYIALKQECPEKED